jgi:hypothetical protein
MAISKDHLKYAATDELTPQYEFHGVSERLLLIEVILSRMTQIDRFC